MPAIYETDKRFQRATLQFFAPNFRCSGGSVEIPDGWQARYKWDHDKGTETAILDLVSLHGRRANVFEGRGIKSPMNPNGYLVPIQEWDAVMTQIVGVTWDQSKISDEEAMAILRNHKS